MEIPNPKHQIPSKPQGFNFPKQLMPSVGVWIFSDFAWDLSFGIWNFHCEVPRSPRRPRDDIRSQRSFKEDLALAPLQFVSMRRNIAGGRFFERSPAGYRS